MARGSSRDWAAKGPKLLGIRAVIAESYERIHRSNLVGMGILPLQFEPGQTAGSLGLTGLERFTIESPGRGPVRPSCRREAADRHGRNPRGRSQAVHGHHPDRYAPGGSVLPEWRNLALCIAAIAQRIRRPRRTRGADGRFLRDPWHGSCTESHPEAENRVSIRSNQSFVRRRLSMPNQRPPFERAMGLAAASGFKICPGAGVPGRLAALPHRRDVGAGRAGRDDS